MNYEKNRILEAEVFLNIKREIGNPTSRLNFGTEAQKGFFNTRDYGNKLGGMRFITI